MTLGALGGESADEKKARAAAIRCASLLQRFRAAGSCHCREKLLLSPTLLTVTFLSWPTTPAVDSRTRGSHHGGSAAWTSSWLPYPRWRQTNRVGMFSRRSFLCYLMVRWVRDIYIYLMPPGIFAVLGVKGLLEYEVGGDGAGGYGWVGFMEVGRWRGFWM